jgi:acetyl-CoA carboxylase biotin carboxyl carrier protein
MDIEGVRDLIQLMVDNDLAELEVQDGERRVALKRRAETVVTGIGAGPVLVQAAGPAAPAAAALPAETKEEETLVTIKSPMVGTFYTAHDPDSPPYVQVGTEVEPDTVVCIIEAMKVFNEIKAEVSGTVEKLLVRNEEPVEFGQPLYAVRPRT